MPVLKTSSDAFTSVYQNFELIDQDDKAEFKEITEESRNDFKNFLSRLVKTERLLQIE